MIPAHGNGDPDRRSALKPLAICADDFGMAPGISSGILELARCARLSAVSCLSQGRSFRQHAPALAGLPVDRGLHLNLTERLQDDEFNRPLSRLLLSCLTRQIDSRRITREVERQLDAFEAVLGEAPDFVDGHQHVHQLPVIRDCLIEVLRRRYPGRLPWLRSTLPAALPTISLPYRLKASLIGCLGGRTFRKLGRQHGFQVNARLLGAYGFTGGAEAYAGLLDRWLAGARAGDLLMCHPAAFVDGGVDFAAQRVAEYTVLAGASFSQLLARYGVEVGRLHHGHVDWPQSGRSRRDAEYPPGP